MPTPSGPTPLFVASGKYVQALDRATGRVIWQRKLSSSFWTGTGFATLLAEGSEVFIGRAGYVYCLDAATGQVLWERGVGSGSSLVVLGTSGSSGQVVAAASAAQQAAAAGAATAAIVASTAAAG
ncbi:MAG: PQQ-binding-like beta-propeller repeat protein [Phycisphaerales bacterium]